MIFEKDKYNTMNNIPEKPVVETPPANRAGIHTSKPNEIGGVYFSSMVKISDPNSGEVLVQIRGDE